MTRGQAVLDAVPAGLELVEIDTIAAVDPASWNTLAAGCSVYSSYPWLRYVEQYGDCTPGHLLVLSPDGPLGALPTYQFRDNVPGFYDPGQLFGTRGPARPLLLAGTRQGYASELLLAPDLPAAATRAVVGLLLSRVRELRDRQGGLAASLYLTDHATGLLAAHAGPADRFLLLDAGARLRVDPTGLAGYRNRVGRKTVARLRNETRRFDAAGCQVRVCRLSECHDRLAALSTQVMRRYGHATTVAEDAARFAGLAQAVDDLCVVLLATLDGRTVGFTQFLLWDGVMYARQHGVDDSVGRDASVYFNLTYYRAIEYAAEHGYRAIDLGCGSFDTKVLRGASLEPLWAFVLDAPWTPDELRRLRREEADRLAQFRAWDAGIPSAAALASYGSHLTGPTAAI